MSTPIQRTLIAVDFENIYYSFARHLKDKTDALAASIEVLRRLREYARTERGLEPVLMFAYADFDRMAESDDNVQTQLYLLGFETRNVLGTEHKNAADMQLCIDVMSYLYSRSDVEGYIIVAGDRDFIPLLRHLNMQGRTVLVAGFRESTSGDLIDMMGESRLVFLNTMHDETRFAFKSKEELDREEAQRLVEKHKEAFLRVTKHQPVAVEAPKDFATSKKTTDPDVLEAIAIMLKEFGDKTEVWVTPYLRSLRTEMSQLAEYERRNLINDMEMIGAIKVEKRHGTNRDGIPVEYSAMQINWNHPHVQELNMTGS